MPHFSLPAEREMVSRARRRTTRLLGNDPRAIDAAVVVSELFTNSVLHSASGEAPVSDVRVTLEITPDMVRIEVLDAGPRQTPPDTRCSEEGDFGRGWLVINGYASKSGHDSAPGKGLAWAELR